MPSSKRASYTVQFKMSVVEWVESTGSSLSAASRKFSVDRKMIRNWIVEKERMRLALLVRGPGKRKLHEGKSPASEELDKLVLEHYLAARAQGSHLNNREVKEAALRYADMLGLRQFKATSSWLACWKGRCGLEPGRDGFGMELEKETVATLLHIASTLLSQVRPSDSVDLSCKQRPQNPSMSCDQPIKSCDSSSDSVSSCVDYTTPEHNYCKSIDGATCHVTSKTISCEHTTSESPAPVQSCDLPMSGEPKTSECHMTSDALSCDQPILADVLDVCVPVLECEVAEMDLPLGNEVEVCHTHETPSLQVKVHSNPDINARSTSPPFFPPLTFDDPQSQGGLLASRMLQPVFPDEPEIVYLDMQLGMLHSMH